MEVMVLVVLAMVLLVHFWPQKPRGYFVSTEAVADFALRMETRVGRLAALADAGRLDAEVGEACLEAVKEPNEFLETILKGGT